MGPTQTLLTSVWVCRQTGRTWPWRKTQPYDVCKTLKVKLHTPQVSETHTRQQPKRNPTGYAKQQLRGLQNAKSNCIPMGLRFVTCEPRTGAFEGAGVCKTLVRGQEAIKLQPPRTCCGSLGLRFDICEPQTDVLHRAGVCKTLVRSQKPEMTKRRG